MGGGKQGIKIHNPRDLVNGTIIDYDEVMIGSQAAYNEIYKELVDMGVPPAKINADYFRIQVQARIVFLEDFAKLCADKGIVGDVAEAGVYRGEFAKEINRIFPDSECRLFDTFEGFVQEDIDKESKNLVATAGHLDTTSVDLVMSKMPHKEKVHVYKGHFPDTAISEGISSRFCFVNLDMDLYQPTKDGIRFFYPLMNGGGVILIHDYFSDDFLDVVRAIKDYEEEENICLAKTPIGDGMSIAIIKH